MISSFLQGITIKGKEIAARAAEVEGHVQSAAGITVRDSGGYPFHILSEDKEGMCPFCVVSSH